MFLDRSTSEDIALFGKRLSFFSQLPIDTFVCVSELKEDIGDVLQLHLDSLRAKLPDLTCLRIIRPGGADPAATYHSVKALTSGCAVRCARLGIELEIAILLCDALWNRHEATGFYHGEGEVQA
jgi:hypothetical protein